MIEIGASWGSTCLGECAWALVTGLATTTATLPAPILILLLPSHYSRQSSQEDSGQANCHVPACVAAIFPGLVISMKNRQITFTRQCLAGRFQGIHRGFKLAITLIIQGVFFFSGPPPKSSKCQPESNYFQKKLEYQDWAPLKVLSALLGLPYSYNLLSTRKLLSHFKESCT